MDFAGSLFGVDIILNFVLPGAKEQNRSTHRPSKDSSKPFCYDGCSPESSTSSSTHKKSEQEK
jgi:hypothetical protein